MEIGARSVYELELIDGGGTVWEFLCDADTGEIFVIEREVSSAADPEFAADMKIDLERAQKIVLERFPGDIDGVEFEIGPDGVAIYDIDVIAGDGVERKVEIDANTGEIIRVAVENWEIGEHVGE